MPTRASIDVGLVQANQTTNHSLAPGIYSLASRSNVPYVSLVGTSGFSKVFTWGEIVEVPCGETCRLRNSSYHAGDVFINCGADFQSRPARITVPVPVVEIDINGVTYVTPTYPADVRMARRAYFSMFGTTALATIAIVTGKRFDGSHNTLNQIVLESGAGYQENFILPPSSDVGPIPLGYRSAMGDDSRPHTLLTTAQPNIAVASFTYSGTAYYTMEY
jgi:hypothetical protein